MSGYTVTMQCQSCGEMVPVPEGNDCPACGGHVLYGHETTLVTVPCEVCGADVQIPDGEDASDAMCGPCIRRVINGEDVWATTRASGEAAGTS